QPTSTGLTKVDSARDIVLVRSKIRNNSANTPKRGLKLYRLNSAKNTTTIRPVTVSSVSDGLSNTVFLGEHAPILSDKTWAGIVPSAAVCTNNPNRFPLTECDHAATLLSVHSGPAAEEVDPITGFAPIHPPNSPLSHVCQMFSEHPNGANVVLGDGSTRFISSSIHQPTWAAMSSRNKGEVFSHDE
ncbi:MAG: DUF1559 domain-containing protein, partial [Pirellula sp.]